MQKYKLASGSKAFVESGEGRSGRKDKAGQTSAFDPKRPFTLGTFGYEMQIPVISKEQSVDLK